MTDDVDWGHSLAADHAVCARMQGLHLSSARAARIVRAASDDGAFEDVVCTVAEELRRELFIEQRLTEAALDTVRAVRGET